MLFNKIFFMKIVSLIIVNLKQARRTTLNISAWNLFPVLVISMKSLVILLLLVEISSGMAPYGSYWPLFEAYKVQDVFIISDCLNWAFQIKFNKSYGSQLDESRAFRNFVKNTQIINNFNSANGEDGGFVLGENRSVQCFRVFRKGSKFFVSTFADLVICRHRNCNILDNFHIYMN